MKKVFTILSLLVTFTSLSQKVKPEKIIFKKEITPLIEAKEYDKALPLLNNYYNQNLIYGEIWNPKAMLLEAHAMFYTEEILGNLYFEKASYTGSKNYIDSSKIWYTRMIKNYNPDSLYAKQQLELIRSHEISWGVDALAREKKIKDGEEEKKHQLELKIASELRVEQLREIAKLKTEDSLRTIQLYVTVDSLIKSELPKLTSLSIYNTFIGKMKKYQTDNKLPFSILPEEYYSFDNITYREEISNQTTTNFTTQNLNKSTFRNGEIIDEAKSLEEWMQFFHAGKPAWCYYNFDSKNKYPYGKFYNTFAIVDKRELAPHGWRITSESDFIDLFNNHNGQLEAGGFIKAIDKEYLGAGFSGVLSGWITKNGFINYDHFGAWATQDRTANGDLLALYADSASNETFFFTTESQKEIGLNIRCVKEDNSYTTKRIPSLKLLLDKREQFIFDEMKKQLTIESLKAFLLKQYLAENSLVSIEKSMDYHDNWIAEKIFERVIASENVSKNGTIFFMCDLGGVEDDLDQIYITTHKINYLNNIVNQVTYEDGSFYSGECDDVWPNGEGKLVIGPDGLNFGIENENVFSYEGSFQNGQCGEFGILKLKDKSVYEGYHSAGFPHGHGKLTTANKIVQEGEFVDGVYKKPFACKTAAIGNQIWMAENLTVTKFQNGDAIPEAKTIVEWEDAGYNKNPAFCYYNNDPATAKTHGLIYNWYALTDVRKISPTGWKLPSHTDHQVLINFLESDRIAIEKQIKDKESQGISTSELESKLIWLDRGGLKIQAKASWKNDKSKDLYGFSAKPTCNRSTGFNQQSYSSDGGYVYSSGDDQYAFLQGLFGAPENTAFYWNSSYKKNSYGTITEGSGLSIDKNGSISLDLEHCSWGYPVRLIKQ
jgi:uncharacterized protein (TIGR02145 family)